ncbi:hypothetical protein [Methylobacterium planeticum]|uniref:Uncharacterized protein n=1 Tax=Methylobacterium planeticum TaxID=2615211 RepID=A0A6N6MQI7_9HYPH|nr:hypothetical protein [Methylobacterium planeticum]KAB1071515.1 hypothetical protein F6X51_19580 [Methylobacterium planeticum]
MSLAQAILCTIPGIPDALRSAEAGTDQELTELIGALTFARWHLMNLQRERRFEEAQRCLRCSSGRGDAGGAA